MSKKQKPWQIFTAYHVRKKDMRRIIREVDCMTNAGSRRVRLDDVADTNLDDGAPKYFWWDFERRQLYVDSAVEPRFETEDGEGGYISMRDALLQDVIDGKANIWPIGHSWYVA